MQRVNQWVILFLRPPLINLVSCVSSGMKNVFKISHPISLFDNKPHVLFVVYFIKILFVLIFYFEIYF